MMGPLQYMSCQINLQSHLVSKLSDFLLHISGALQDFRQGDGRGSDARQHSTPHLWVGVILEDQHVSWTAERKHRKS